MAVRIPMDETVYLNLPPVGLSKEDYKFMDQLYLTHPDQLEYRTYKYPTANRFTYHSKDVPIDVWDDDADFLTIDNFYDLLPESIIDKFKNYFTDEFYAISCNPAWRGTRLYLNKPNAYGVHIHKDIYSGGGIPRQVTINIPVSANSMTSDLNFFDDELEPLATIQYQYDTPTVLNTTMFHGVKHHDHSDIRKIITISTALSYSEFEQMLAEGRVTR